MLNKATMVSSPSNPNKVMPPGFTRSVTKAAQAAVRKCIFPALLGVLMCCSATFAQNPEGTTVDAQTKANIKGALKYLASKQHVNGSWSSAEGGEGHPVAMTGYNLLAFMAAGNLPDQGEYAKNVAAGMQFLLDSVQPDGILFGVKGQQYMYNHGIATIALAELYGEAHSAAIQGKLQKMIDVILKAQASVGGWRYTPHPSDADISVTVLQVVALRAAQEAGFAVPQNAIDKAISYVSSCYDGKSGGFAYQPGQGAGFARTAAAIYSLQVLGKYDDPIVKTGSQYLFAHAKERQWFAYGNYYAAPAQYMVGGDVWRNWYNQVKQNLNSSVRKEGDMAYWDDKDGAPGLGPVFYTAVYVHVLSMPFHFVPLYQR